MCVLCGSAVGFSHCVSVCRSVMECNPIFSLDHCVPKKAGETGEELAMDLRRWYPGLQRTPAMGIIAGILNVDATSVVVTKVAVRAGPLRSRTGGMLPQPRTDWLSDDTAL